MSSAKWHPSCLSLNVSRDLGPKVLGSNATCGPWLTWALVCFPPVSAAADAAHGYRLTCSPHSDQMSHSATGPPISASLQGKNTSLKNIETLWKLLSFDWTKDTLGLNFADMKNNTCTWCIKLEFDPTMTDLYKCTKHKTLSNFILK